MKTEPRLTFGEALINGLFIHKNDKGRSRRSEFWWCALFLFIASLAAYLWQCTRDSEMFSNRYGKSPKYIDEFADVYIEMPTVD